jgi:hypothetical protein
MAEDSALQPFGHKCLSEGQQPLVECGAAIVRRAVEDHNLPKRNEGAENAITDERKKFVALSVSSNCS